MKINICHRSEEIEVESDNLEPLFERFDFGYKYDPVTLNEEGIAELDRLCNVLELRNNRDYYCNIGWSADPLGLLLLNKIIKNKKEENLEQIFLQFAEEYVKYNGLHMNSAKGFERAITPAICWEVYNNENKRFWKAFEFKEASHEASCYLGYLGVPI
jgi:hypothetical protein